MLVRYLSWSPLPSKFATGAIDETDRTDLAKADEQIAVGRDVNGIAMGPFTTGFKRTYHILCKAQMLPRMPFINHVAVRADLLYEVTEHLLRIMRCVESTAHLRGDFRGQQ